MNKRQIMRNANVGMVNEGNKSPFKWRVYYPWDWRNINGPNTSDKQSYTYQVACERMRELREYYYEYYKERSSNEHKI